MLSRLYPGMPRLWFRVLALFALTCFGLAPSTARAQAIDPTFNSFARGTILNIPNTNQLSAIFSEVSSGGGTNLSFQLGFLTETQPILIKISSASTDPNQPSPGPGTDSIVAIDAVYLVQNVPNGFPQGTTDSAGAPVRQYDGNLSPINWAGISGPPGAPGGGFPYYTDVNLNTGKPPSNGSFGNNGNYLQTGGSTQASDPQQGTFNFTSISSDTPGDLNNPLNPIMLGAHVLDANGKTFFVTLTPGVSTNAATPEPQAVILWACIGLSLGAYGAWSRRRRLVLA